MASEPPVSVADLSAEDVGTTRLVQPAHLNLFHRNARKGDVDGIAGSLAANGQYAPIIVNLGTLTGRPNEVLAGNHTLMAFRSLAAVNPFDQGAWRLIKVHVLDVDDEAANKIVVADNQTYDLGEGIDQKMVYEILKEQGTRGTGYTDDEFDALEAAIDKTTEDEDAPLPPEQEKADRAIGYTLVFDDVEQEGRWFEFVKWLKSEYPDSDLTIADRLLAHLKATESERC